MGRLFLVPTPIGNLKDITLRAIEVMKQADLILAEDTRTTGKLLKHFEIDTPMQSHHMYNEHKSISRIQDRLGRGEEIALVSDAGTPGISDPGFLLVRASVEAGYEVTALPGPTAFVPALVSSGIPCDRFVFEGFLPVKKGRETRLKLLAEEQRTMVFYESPHKLLKTLGQFEEYFGQDRVVAIGREISKLHEEIVRGSIAEVKAHFLRKSPKGEFVIVLAGKAK